jgi:hypothetical protein
MSVGIISIQPLYLITTFLILIATHTCYNLPDMPRYTLYPGLNLLPRKLIPR